MECRIGLFPISCQTNETRRIKNIIEFNFPPAEWNSAAPVDRPFVSYPHPESSPGDYWCSRFDCTNVRLSVVIPTSDAWRDGYFIKLLSQIKQQDHSNFELIVVKGDHRQGRAINIGAALAKGKYIITLDDDTALPDPGTFQKLEAVMETHPDIGIAGGNNVIPEKATPFIRRAMQEIPRRSWEPVQAITDSDLAEHPCMIMRKVDFMTVGGENELIPRGLDPYLRNEFRKAGKRVVVVPGVIYHHLPPDSFRGLIKQFYRNGKQAAFVNLNYPHWVIETPSRHGDFISEKPFVFRILRFTIQLGRSLYKFQLIHLSAEISYALGFLNAYISNKKRQLPLIRKD